MLQKFDCTKNYSLEDDRALLRPLQQEDKIHLLPFALQEPELWKYSRVSAEGEEGMQLYLDTVFVARAEGKEYPFIVFDKASNQYAGSTRFYDIQNELDTVQLGYTWYGARFQGTGLNKHCKYLLLTFAFETIGFERLELRADSNNVRSIAAMKSLGCTVDGVLRKNMPTREPGRRRDSIVLSILREEWFGGVKENLRAKLS